VAYSNTGMNEPADAQIKEWMRQELRGLCVWERGRVHVRELETGRVGGERTRGSTSALIEER